MRDHSKKMFTIFVCSLFIVTSIATFAYAEKYPKEILIGAVLPLSGGSASQGAQLRTGAEIALDQINGMGGIKNMGGAKLKLIFGDSKTTPDGGVAEAERLITREKIAGGS